MIARLESQLVSVGMLPQRTDCMSPRQETRKKRKPGAGCRPARKNVLDRASKASTHIMGTPAFATDNPMKVPKRVSPLKHSFSMLIVLQVSELSTRRKPDLRLLTAGQGAKKSQLQDSIASQMSRGVLRRPSDLLSFLPSKEQTCVYLEAFSNRVQPCTFPYFPTGCSASEISLLFLRVEPDSKILPDKLAVLFAALAHGVAERADEQSASGDIGDEAPQGSVYGEFMKFLTRKHGADLRLVAAAWQALQFAKSAAEPTIAMIEAQLLLMPHFTSAGKVDDSRTLFSNTVSLAKSIGRRSLSAYFYLTGC